MHELPLYLIGSADLKKGKSKENCEKMMNIRYEIKWN